MNNSMKTFKVFYLSFAFFISSLAHAGYSIGTGFFITSDGYIATNYHVVDGGKSIAIRLRDGKSLSARLVRSDKKNDLAILKVDGSGYKYLNLQPSSNIKRGTKIYAMGFPHVFEQGIEPKLTEGIISSLSGLDDEPTTFQISNPIQQGNSGGPIFTAEGKVIGVVVSSINPEIFVKNGTLPQNVNYAVKSSYLLELINSVNEFKYHVESGTVKMTYKNLEDYIQDVNNGLVIIIVDLNTNPPKIETQQAPRESASPRTNSHKQSSVENSQNSRCNLAYKAIIDSNQLDNFKTLVDNDCNIIHRAGWKPGNGVVNPTICQPAWNGMTQTGMIANGAYLVANSCPVPK